MDKSPKELINDFRQNASNGLTLLQKRYILDYLDYEGCNFSDSEKAETREIVANSRLIGWEFPENPLSDDWT